jgi:DNA (cytosine-5)-methyltransferase 1
VRTGSLFSGVGGIDLGLRRAGFDDVAWMCEIDPQCQDVLRRQYPDVHIHGDIETFQPSSKVDVVSFGSPCQDLSIAGKGAGLAGTRSGLFYEAIRVVAETQPEIALWENVPGALSSNRGADFLAVLRAFRDIGAVDIGWRVLDAQWLGVAQRRRRLFLVADFRARRAGEILALEQGVSGDPPEIVEAWQATAESVAGSAGASSIYWDGGQLSDTLDVSMLVKGQMLPEKRRFPVVLQSALGFGSTGGAWEEGNNHELSPPVRVGSDRGIPSPPAVVYRKSRRAQSVNDYETWVEDGIANTLNAFDVGDVRSTNLALDPEQWTLRRLTPREAERLQGMPDDWTLCGASGKEMSDSTRYRMIGNSVAVPVLEWIGRRIREVLA